MYMYSSDKNKRIIEHKLQWGHKELRLSVHFALILSNQNLQTNQFRENSQQEKFLLFWLRLQWSLFENPMTNIREVPKMIFLRKINYLTDFWPFHKVKSIFG